MRWREWPRAVTASDALFRAGLAQNAGMASTSDTLLPDTLQWLPRTGPAQQLMLLFHGWCGTAADMAPAAAVLQQAFPQALLLAPQGFAPADGDRIGRQWFSLDGLDGDDEAQRTARVAAALPALLDWVRRAQEAAGVAPAGTALLGFAQGAIMSLAVVDEEDGLAGRVLAFSGRYARLPQRAPRLSTLHLFHGEADPVIPVALAHQAMTRLAELRADATADFAQGVGHELHPALLRCALQRLTTHIPQRTWAEAMGAAPG